MILCAHMYGKRYFDLLKAVFYIDNRMPLKRFLTIKKWILSIQIAGYNGAHTVHKLLFQGAKIRKLHIRLLSINHVT